MSLEKPLVYNYTIIIHYENNAVVLNHGGGGAHMDNVGPTFPKKYGLGEGRNEGGEFPRSPAKRIM